MNHNLRDLTDPRHPCHRERWARIILLVALFVLLWLVAGLSIDAGRSYIEAERAAAASEATKRTQDYERMNLSHPVRPIKREGLK